MGDVSRPRGRQDAVRMPRVQQVGAVSAPILVLTLPEKALCCQQSEM